MTLVEESFHHLKAVMARVNQKFTGPGPHVVPIRLATPPAGRGAGYNHPPRGRVWVHVDRFDKRNGRTWAVQHWRGNRCVEWTAKDVKILATPASGRLLENGKQPRAVIEIEGAKVCAVGSGSIVISRAGE